MIQSLGVAELCKQYQQRAKLSQTAVGMMKCQETRDKGATLRRQKQSGYNYNGQDQHGSCKAYSQRCMEMVNRTGRSQEHDRKVANMGTF